MNIKVIRKQFNMTQDEFAQYLGVARATVNRWEQGKTKPSRLAQHYINELAKGSITTPDITKVVEPLPCEEPRETKVIEETEKVITVS